ncbi:MAG: RluA family pseudouridine synthase [Negativibacillus sp.]
MINRVKPEDSGVRLDKWIADHVEGYSRSAAQKKIDSGEVFVNERSSFGKNYKVKANDLIQVPELAEESTEILGENIPLDIVYEDEHLLVVNKPKHMVVHPADGNPDGTLVNALIHHCGPLTAVNGDFRQGIVHRIDKDTSGLLVVAKTDSAYEGLAEQVRAHSMDRYYEAVVYGGFKEDSGTVNAPLGRHPVDRKKMAVLRPNDPNAREAVTHWSVLRRYKGFTHIRLKLETGRTHQIRVHMAYLQHPLAGDPVYGPKKCIAQLEGQCLHARTLGFIHPITGEHLLFESPLPDYFTRFLKTLQPMDE